MKSVERLAYMSNRHIRFIGMLGLLVLFSLSTATSFVSAQDLFVSSYLNSSVKEYNGTNGAFIGDFVPHDTGGLAGTHGLVFGPDGNLYVNSYWENAIKRFDGIT